MLDTICVGGSFCLANAAVGEATAETTASLFHNINPNLPSGISVGYHGDNEISIFCLEGDKDEDGSLGNGTICYKNIPTIHSILSRFNLNDYKPEPKSSLLHDEEEKDDGEVLSLEDIDSLVSGMWLDCRWGLSDEAYYEAMFLTAEQNLQEGLIGIEYDDENNKKWVPISWCKVAKPSADEKAWQCDVSQDAADSQCDFISYASAGDGPFHRAFKALSEIKKHKQSESSDNENDEGKVIFTYAQFEAAVEDEDGYMEMGLNKPLPAQMKASSYTTIYSHLPFVHPTVTQVDDKFKLYQLYKDDPIASKVFPKSYSSYREALLDTKTEHEDKRKSNRDDGKVTFYIKDSGATRGEGIYIKTWDELSLDYDKLKAGGEYDVDGGEGDVIIQQAVTDLHTIKGDGPIAGRRFDIRYYVLIANGSVYIHSYMMFRWSLGPKYDPNDTNIEHQVINTAQYSGGDMARLPLSGVPLGDVNGNGWNNNEKKRRSVDPHSHSSAGGVDAHGWRDAVADALDDASGVFSTLKELTKADPTKYVLAGGDAMIKEDGSAVIVEFNIWPDVSYFKGLTQCLAGGGGCRRMVVMSEDDSNIDADNYHVTEHSPACDIVSSEFLAELLMDTASIVMKIQPAHEIERFREIVTRNEQQD